MVFRFDIGSQIEKYGRIAAERCYRSGYTTSNTNANPAMGREFGASAL